MSDVQQIQSIQSENIEIPIIGTSPLIVHAWSAKQKTAMLDAQQGRKSPKARRDPEADYEASFYRTNAGEYGFPILAFKDATTKASRYYGKEVTLVGLRQCMFFSGEYSETAGQSLVKIEGEPTMREDVVRIGMGTTDLRYRPMFLKWGAVLSITYVKSSLTMESIVALVDAGGMGIGVGEWRPEKKGDYGTYRVDPARKIEVVG